MPTKSMKRRASAPPPSPPRVPPPRFTAPIPDSPVKLGQPVEYAGRTYATITRRRPSSGVLGRWFEQFVDGGGPMDGSADGEMQMNMPIFVDEDGNLVPDAVLGFLDDDDRQAVFVDTDPFFPKRLAVALEVLTRDSVPPSGEPAEPTSSAS